MVDAEGSPRIRRREAKLEQILDVAMATVAERGFSSLSINKLAGAVDYTPGALYRYFDSKDALVGALVDRVLREVGARLKNAAEAAGPEPLTRLFAVTDAYRRFSVDEPHKFGLLAMSMAEPEVLLVTEASTAPVVAAMVAALAPIAAALTMAAHAETLEAGDARERTILLFGAIQGVVQLRKQARVAPELLDSERLSARALRTLLRGWGADPARIDEAYERSRVLTGTGLRGEPS